MTAPGTFISVEGGDGAGKTTQVGLLVATLRALGIKVVRTREPGGSPGAERLREILLDPTVPLSPLAQAFLHYAARQDHLDSVIVPALDYAGLWVVSDRYMDSTTAYQGLLDDYDTVAALTKYVPWPDVTLVLDVDDAVAEARLSSRSGTKDRYEAAGLCFQRRVRRQFREIAADNQGRCVLINANGTVAQVHERIMAALRDRTILPSAADSAQSQET